MAHSFTAFPITSV